MDTKATFDREAFEKSAAELTGYKPEFILSQRAGDDYEFGSGLNAYWHFWKESRAAIEIEFPEEKPYKHNSYPEARAQDDGFNDALSECSAIITSHGIIIKGKTE
ncbi:MULTISPECIES: hypothetical protein [Rahnella]|uniref:Uncharacterized protein n=1 Tax=Rahnella laticis TaxID=2787622 RepID=A0ABS0DZ63_9GAMM|nr:MULTISPECIES: hypothetical protein [Rahnella]MBF7978095.1 hypothetical protein [Rahnella laticis]MBF7998188.1 hypothetical protein [Rahnella sp. LAC-M12]